MNCETCNDKGYIELDKVGLICQPCPDCEKGKETSRTVGFKGEIDGDKGTDSGDRRAFEVSGSEHTRIASPTKQRKARKVHAKGRK